MKIFSSFSIVLFFGLIFVSGCNMPTSRGNGSPTPDVTQAYQTVEARLTDAAQVSPSEPPTLAPSTTPTFQLATATNPVPTIGSPPTNVPTPVSKLCDQAEAGTPIDVTTPDDTKLAPGATFTKVWRLRNSGTCTWTKNYTIAVFSGEPMNAPDNVKLPRQVEPGASVDISVDLTAPSANGSYQGNWKLKNEAGTWFGIGPGGNSPFWVRIIVAGGTVTPVTSTPGETTPTETTPPNPPVVVSGANTMGANDRLDLDSNTLNSGGGDDINLQPNPQGRLMLTTLGSAGMVGFGTGVPSFYQCQGAGAGPASVAVRNLPKGYYVCYRTDQGLFGWLRVISFNETAGILNLQVNTWALP